MARMLQGPGMPMTEIGVKRVSGVLFVCVHALILPVRSRPHVPRCPASFPGNSSFYPTPPSSTCARICPWAGLRESRPAAREPPSRLPKVGAVTEQNSLKQQHCLLFLSTGERAISVRPSAVNMRRALAEGFQCGRERDTNTTSITDALSSRLVESL